MYMYIINGVSVFIFLYQPTVIEGYVDICDGLNVSEMSTNVEISGGIDETRWYVVTFIPYNNTVEQVEQVEITVNNFTWDCGFALEFVQEVTNTTRYYGKCVNSSVPIIFHLTNNPDDHIDIRLSKLSNTTNDGDLVLVFNLTAAVESNTTGRLKVKCSSSSTLSTATSLSTRQTTTSFSKRLTPESHSITNTVATVPTTRPNQSITMTKLTTRKKATSPETPERSSTVTSNANISSTTPVDSSNNNTVSTSNIFSSTAFNTMVPDLAVGSNSTNESNQTKNSTEAVLSAISLPIIIGSVIGGSVLLLICFLTVCVCLLKRRKTKEYRSEMNMYLGSSLSGAANTHGGHLDEPEVEIIPNDLYQSSDILISKQHQQINWSRAETGNQPSSHRKNLNRLSVIPEGAINTSSRGSHDNVEKRGKEIQRILGPKGDNYTLVNKCLKI